MSVEAVQYNRDIVAIWTITVSSSLRSRQERCDASSKGNGINQKGKLVIRK